ncbi:2978_t:CDS:2, partial [Acaulospora colombiana]
MKVTRLQLGVYNGQGNQQPFCLYLFPLVASSQQDMSPKTTIHSPFYRLRDIDTIFFESPTEFMFKTGKIPKIYFDTPGYCFYERSGDIFLSARAVGETATRLGNHLLAEFCKYGREDIISGMADRLLSDITILSRMAPAEAEFEFFSISSPCLPTFSPRSDYGSHVGSPSNLGSPTKSPHLIPPPPVSGKKRMSFEEILHSNDSSDDKRHSPRMDQSAVSPAGSDKGTSTFKQETSATCSKSDRSDIRSPNRSPRSSPHSPSFPDSQGALIINDDIRLRKKRRVAVSPIGSNKIKATNNPEVMEQVRNTLKRHSVAGYNNSGSSSHGAWDSTKRTSTARVNRNSRNLSVFAPPYNDTHSRPCVVNGQNHASSLSNGHDPLPMTAPITRSASNKQSSFGYSLSTNSAFRPAIKMHSASTSASINGLISPHNIDDVHPERSPMTSPQVSIQFSPSTAASPMLPSEQPTKESFVNLFDNFYDAVADTRSLKSTLEEQIRKTTTLLQALQASGSMIESLVRGHFREMQTEVVKDLVKLEKRIAKVEERMRQSTNVGMSPSPPIEADRRLSDISTASSDMGYGHQNENNEGSPRHLSVGQPSQSSPPLSAGLSRGEETQQQDYQEALSAIKARLESLERRIDAPKSGLLHNVEYTPIPRLKERTVPVHRWIVQVVLFFTVSVLNNIALGYRISVPLHIIFRSGGLMVSMILGWALAGKRYTMKQVISVVMVTLGVALATISSANINTKDVTIDVSTSDYVMGITLLSIALILSCIMGLYQEFTYKKYGSNWREGLFYTHFLALPLFFLFYSDIKGQIQSFNNSPLVSLDDMITKFKGDLHSFGRARSVMKHCYLPQTWIYLLINSHTSVQPRFVCVSGVHRLNSISTALTLNLVLNLRKFTSLVISVWFFDNEFHFGMKLGGLL